MRTVTLDVRSVKDSLLAAGDAVKSRKAADTARISFASAELLWAVLTAKRWEILRAMTGAGALSVREIARQVGRDVKAVHADVQALLAAGVLSKSERRVIFPYDAVHVDFVLSAVA
jgi:predicted transcriptional regulator